MRQNQAACSEPLAVFLHARNRAPDLKDLRVLITGAGPIGVLCAALAADAGAAEIVTSDLLDFPLAVAERMGATRVINIANNPDDLEAYSSNKRYFDVAFECSAAAPAIRSALSAVRPQGTIIQVGVTGDALVPINLLVGKKINLLGSHRFHHEFADAVRLIENRAIDVRPMITGTFPLEDAVAAFDTAGDRSRAIKNPPILCKWIKRYEIP